MKGLQPLFLGIFGVFTFSWLGMTVVPNLQIGSLNPQTDEDGGDVYPAPPSGMVLRGAQVYAANGCVYCHSQQVRPDYGGSDLERKWGERRSAPRDYTFQPIVFLGVMRTGPDLGNVGHLPSVEEKGSTTAPPVPAAGGTTSAAGASATVASPPTVPSAGPGAPATTPARPASPASAAGAPAPSPASAQLNSNAPKSAPPLIANVNGLTADGKPLPYTVASHHRHLYNARSVSENSNMPAYRFLYEKRRITGSDSPDAINFAGDPREEPEAGWEIVPSYDAKCLVAYLISRDQSHALKEAKAPATLAPSPAKEASK
jgi:cbb3-type cytochrome oxidase cytochrome c subunit